MILEERAEGKNAYPTTAASSVEASQRPCQSLFSLDPLYCL